MTTAWGQASLLRTATCRVAMALPLCLMLAGCGSLNEQFGGSVWVTPGKYAYHSCLQMQDSDTGFAARQKELEELMARASQGTGGYMIGQAVYRTEYQQVLGERQALVGAMRNKRCQVEGPSQSGKSVF